MAFTFASIKNNLQRQKFIKMFEFVAEGTNGAAKCALIPADGAAKIMAAEPDAIEYVTNATPDANGNVAVRLKQSQPVQTGAPTTGAAVSSTTTTSTEGTKMNFTLETGIPLPTIQRGGLKGETYPFDQMAIGQSFFVAATADKPNPAKSLASTVSSATKRYAKKDGRKFTVRSVVEYRDAQGKLVPAGTPGATEVKGARIWREADAPASAPATTQASA